jgi:hypothetical protein
MHYFPSIPSTILLPPDESSAQALIKDEIRQTLEQCETLYTTHSGTLSHFKKDIDMVKIY